MLAYIPQLRFIKTVYGSFETVFKFTSLLQLKNNSEYRRGRTNKNVFCQQIMCHILSLIKNTTYIPAHLLSHAADFL